MEQRAWARGGMPDAALVIHLTYDNENLPYSGPEDPSDWDFEKVKSGEQRVPRPTLVKKHLQKYIKRVRKRFPDRAINYVGVGEYGELRGRPHYHVIMFGVVPDDEPVLRQLWPYGEQFQCDPLIMERAAYVAGYTLKKLTPEKKDENIAPAAPEFSHWSLKPAIGKRYVPYLVDSLEQHPELVREFADVTFEVRLGGKKWPVDRNMRKWMRAEWNGRNAFQIPETHLERSSIATLTKKKKEHTLEEMENISNAALRFRRKGLKVF